MAYYNDVVLDAALQVFRTITTPVLHICSQEPADYTEASDTYSLGSKVAPVITAQADRAAGGRKVEISTFADGTVDADGTGAHWALVDANDNRLLAVVDIAPAEQQDLVDGNALQMTSPIILGVADAA